jgi:predicted MPP superfamily phosphohydrolase
MTSRRRFLATAATFASGVGLGLYTWYVEPHWLEIVRRPLPVKGLPDALNGRTLAHLSDLHTGPRVDDAYLVHTLARVRALRPDIVAYTGDYITYERGVFARATRVYADLPRGRLATFGVLGNHDYGPGWSHPEIAERVTELLTKRGVRVLRNEVGEVGGLQVAGLDDTWANRFDVASTMEALDPARPAIALSHNPDSADRPAWDRFRGWILAGHTHGGQVKPPFLPPPLLPVRNRRYVAGEVAISGGRRLYISRGVGHLWHVRFCVRPEVTLFELRPA